MFALIPYSAINQRRLEEDRKLNEELSKYTSLQQTHEHTKQEVQDERYFTTI
jgi:hypothetical protein